MPGSKSIETITGEEFVQRFCLHILPKHSSRLSTVGLFQTKQRPRRLALVQHLLSIVTCETYEQTRIAAELAKQEIVEPVLRTGSCLDPQRRKNPFGELARLTAHAPHAVAFAGAETYGLV